MKGQEHGGDPEAALRKYGLAPREVIDFSASINPLGPPEAVRTRWPKLLGTLPTYPSIEHAGIGHYARARFDLEAEHVLGGNGSVEFLYLLPDALKLQHIGVLTPCFSDYARSVQAKGAILEERMVEEEIDLLDRLDDDWLSKLDAVILGHPNNPDGRCLNPEALLAKAEAHPHCHFIIDEAFLFFHRNAHALSLARPDRLRPNILILHSLTKYFSLAGLRMGLLLGLPDTLRRVAATQPPWSLNHPALELLEVLAECPDFDERSRNWLDAETPFVESGLGQLPGLRPLSSPVNFLLCEYRGERDFDHFYRDVLASGIHLRDARNFKGLTGPHFRLGIRERTDNKQLLEVLQACLEERSQ